MKYVVVYEQAPHNWAAYVPDLPGCVAAAETREETRQLIREAIALHVDSLRRYGEPIPAPGAWTEAVEADESILDEAETSTSTSPALTPGS
jgi:predicted RNase H-like HicB family nuclease